MMGTQQQPCPICGLSAWSQVQCLDCERLVCWTCCKAGWDKDESYYRKCFDCLRSAPDDPRRWPRQQEQLL